MTKMLQPIIMFSNTLAPSIVGASLKAIDLIEKNNSIIEKLKNNTMLFREKMSKLGFDIKGKTHPIVPESILRDRNHPSIVQWELFNEIKSYLVI